MAIQFPRELLTGTDPADREAEQLYLSLAWYARALREIRADAQLDKKKLGWLIMEGTRYRATYASLAARIAREGIAADPDYVVGGVRPAGTIASIAQRYFAVKSMTWVSIAAMLADLTSVNTDIANVLNWIKANVPDYGTYASFSATLNADNTQVIQVESAILVALDPAVLQQVNTLAARFTGMP